MRFLANENFPLVSVGLLRSAGHPVIAITEDSPGVPDSVVLACARSEECVLLTFDRDYGELIFRRRLPPPAGVLYLRFDPISPHEPGQFVLSLLERIDIQLTDKFTTATRDTVRQRSLLSFGLR
jgi:predicted nuclease of predicted toxin-antitoxin system